MRCLSPYAKYSIQIHEGNEQIVVDARGTATTITLAKPVIGNFDRLGLLDHEIESALEYFNFSGVPEGVNPLTRIGVFDTEAFVQQYPDSERSERLIQIDSRLRELQVRHPGDFIIVEPLEIPRPWPSYDEDSAVEIINFQQRLRVNPEDVRRYEEQREKPRVTIINAMLEQEDPDFVAVPAEKDVEVVA